jgi:hypothetical protein
MEISSERSLSGGYNARFRLSEGLIHATLTQQATESKATTFYAVFSHKVISGFEEVAGTTRKLFELLNDPNTIIRIDKQDKRLYIETGGVFDLNLVSAPLMEAPIEPTGQLTPSTLIENQIFLSEIKRLQQRKQELETKFI